MHKGARMFGNIYILGTHTLARSYFQKITHAKNQGLIHVKNCELVPDPYSDFILNYLEKNQTADLHDTLVPDHTAKHVLLQVFLDVIQKRFPQLETFPVAFKSDFTTPFLHKSADESVWAVSYATWTCPPDCDEPKICPHIEDTRTWDFNDSLAKLFAAQPQNTKTYRFSCARLVEEISHIPMIKIQNAVSDYLKALKNHPPQKVIVATHSHCHGIFGQFGIQPVNCS